MESRSRAAGDLARMTGMPKIVDYAGRFAFFELAGFTLVRDHGVDHPSRNALARVLATSPGVSAPSTADVPADSTFDPEHDQDEDDVGHLHHRFAVANYGYVPSDVLAAAIERPRTAVGTDGEVDRVVAARQERDEELAHLAAVVVRTAAPDRSHQDVQHHAEVLHAVVDGLGIAVSLGRMRPEEAVVLARDHLARLARVEECRAPSP